MRYSISNKILAGAIAILFTAVFFAPLHAQVTHKNHSLRVDSAAADSLPPVPPLPFISYPFINYPGPLFYIKVPSEKINIVRDSSGRYISRRYLYNIPVAEPYVMNFHQYEAQSRRQSERSNWQELIREYEQSQTKSQGLMNFKFNIPAGRKSAFATIFGKNEVNLQVNGTANMNVGASISKTENPQVPPDQQTQVSPTFNQNLKLNIQGKIGDKLFIRTNWNTQAAFNFQNRVNILYKGYSNEILQRLQLGNVSMESGNSLIRGGQALFGVKSVVKLGSLKLTSVLSQQNGQANTQTITGGAKKRRINLRPADYEYDKNFFLDFYTRQQFEQDMSNPQKLGQALQLTEVKVWVLRQSQSSSSAQGERKAIALVPLGDVDQGDSTFAPPNGANDAFPNSLLNKYRDPSVGVSASDFNVDPSEFVEGYFVPLQQGKDYEVNRALGFITLKRTLSSRQALAVSFKYKDPRTGKTISVGDVSQGGSNRIYLKLIRPPTMTTTNPAWKLMMKNIYNLGVKNITQEGLNLDIKYTEPNVPSSSLPDLSTPLLQQLGLDRVNQQGAVTPDNKVDFSTGTLNPADGRIIFPYLQPFGNRIQSLLVNSGLSKSQINHLTFEKLYRQKQVKAQEDSKNNYYSIRGSSKGSVSNHYSLGLSPVRGSVHVYANGEELQKGTDYRVDYSIGSVTILNDRYLQKGQQIKIKYEKNQLSQIKQRRLTGVRADYTLGKNINIGSTYFHLKEQPNQDKIRLGNEPVNNTVLGFDAKAHFNLPWLTRVLDWMPLLQTKAPSHLRISGEFAQLRPGVAHTNAVARAIKNNRLTGDQKNGLSYIDDFEGDDINISFRDPSRWHIAAAPAAVPGYAPDKPYFGANPPQSLNVTLSTKIARSDLRSQFSWYTIPRNVDRILGNVSRTPETQPVRVTDVFPNRDVLSGQNYISTLDVHYNPDKRGQYNYNDNLKTLLNDHPGHTWGGMTTTLPSGEEDLSQNNVEYVEFWVEPILPNGRTPTAQDKKDYNGHLYIDIGKVSEDVIPNFKTNTEDGLARRPSDLQVDNYGQQARSYIPNPLPPPQGQFSNKNRAKEDVGLDGAPDRGGIDNKNEQTLFSSFIKKMRAEYGTNSQQFKKIKNDPSNDDYVYYGESKLKGEPLQKRFYRMYGYTEGNTPPNTSNKRAITNKPNTEGLINPSHVQKTNAYYEYQINLNPATINKLQPGAKSNYIADKIPGSRQQDRWYHFKIPLKQFKRKFGNIQNFQDITHIRVWMSGYKKPFTLRFATFKLVGNQWQHAKKVDANQNSQANLNISTVNIEEDSRRQPIPYRQPRGAVRPTNQERKRKILGNEQSLVLKTKNLGPGELKMIKRDFPGGLNMTNYSHVRMYVHGEGYKSKNDLELVVRFGTDLVNNYYEYRQPITPTSKNFPFSNKPLSKLSNAERRREARAIWKYSKNNMNVLLSAFKQLKQLRDQKGVPTDKRFERSDLLSDSVPGAVLAIKGNPSLDRISEIGMGVENPFDPNNVSKGGTPSVDSEVWVDELRVSGFHNRKGFATKGKVNLKLADFASVNLDVNQRTDGFGALDSRLGQRSTSDQFAYDLNSTFNMNKFIPDRFGWSFPVSVSARQSTSTPRYLPNEGDVTIKDFKRAVRARKDLNAAEKNSLIDRRINQSQMYSRNFSLNISNATKNFSHNAFGKYILDNTTLNYIYNKGLKHNPEYSHQRNWNYSGSLRYNINFNQNHFLRPFGFLGGIPLLRSLAGLRFGYAPSSINSSVGINRSYTEQQRRSVPNNQRRNTRAFPLQQSHSFTYNTNFGFSYNLTPSINTAFHSRTVYDLSRAGIWYEQGAAHTDSSVFRVKPTFTVLKNLLSDTLSARRNNYKESYSANWQPHLEEIDPIQWINYSASYNGGYQWRNSPLGSELGATVSNNMSLSQSLKFNIREWMNNSSRYQNSRQGQSYGDEKKSGLGHILARGARGFVKSLLNIQTINASFNISTSSVQSGYAGRAPFFDQFNRGGNHFSPPFSYRTGFAEVIGLNRLVDNNNSEQSIQLPSNRNLNDNLTVDMRFLPFKNLTLDLTWNTQWNKTNTRSVTIAPDQSSNIIRNENGKIISSVWAFGGGYANFFRNQLKIAMNDISSQTDTLSDGTGNQDGLSVLGRYSLQQSFRKAYLGVLTGTVGDRGFTPFPLPGWRISWTGIENTIPFIGRFIKHASLLDKYSGRYRLSYDYNADQSLLPPMTLGNYIVQNRRDKYAPATINIEKNFSPLVGLNITWISDLQTNLQYNYSKITSLALSNATVVDEKSQGIKLTVDYTMRNFKIPLFPRINNAVDLTINSSYNQDIEKKYVLSSDLGDALKKSAAYLNPANAGFSGSFTGGQDRINGSLIVGYHFSQTVKANFEYDYQRLIPKSTGVYSRTDQEVKFNIIVAIHSQ
ncbi:MAG TPA: cell surface protein SprA [Balneolaceae bacterium]|nr:cell surface protein SprA [Balneolaceae bacterium]